MLVGDWTVHSPSMTLPGLPTFPVAQLPIGHSRSFPGHKPWQLQAEAPWFLLLKIWKVPEIIYEFKVMFLTTYHPLSPCLEIMILVKTLLPDNVDPWVIEDGDWTCLEDTTPPPTVGGGAELKQEAYVAISLWSLRIGLKQTEEPKSDF